MKRSEMLELANRLRDDSNLTDPVVSSLLNEAAAALIEIADDEALTVDDLMAQAALDRCMKWAYDMAKDDTRTALNLGYATEVGKLAAGYAYDIADAMLEERKQR